MLRTGDAVGAGGLILIDDCVDPFSVEAVRASMGSLFARPPARAGFTELTGMTIALERGAGTPLSEVSPEAPVVVCLGAERDGLPPQLAEAASARAEIPLRPDGPDSLNVAMAATVALYDLANRMAPAHG